MATPVGRRLRELLLQALEHERGGTLVYSAALECALDEHLREEWEKYLEQTLRHVEILTSICRGLGLDPDESTPGCQIIHHNGKSLVVAMKMARANGDRVAAQLVACDCVVLAETKDHANWELIGECARQLGAEGASVLEEAYEEVRAEEDEHLVHTKGWCRGLWLQSLGLNAVLPPPEEPDRGSGGNAGRNVVKEKKTETSTAGR